MNKTNLFYDGAYSPVRKKTTKGRRIAKRVWLGVRDFVV